MPEYQLIHGDCLEKLKDLPDNSVDAVVTDPPYGISFMAKHWDYDVPQVEVWEQVLRVLKPGGHALIACGTRTQHRMVVNIEDAGFEIRDVVSWIYGSGFPKSHNVSKAIDKAAGAEREVVGKMAQPASAKKGTFNCSFDESKAVITAPATEAAKQWDGWGTALKPACEFFTLARKPLSEKTVAANVLKWGTGGINIDGCRVGTETRTSKGMSSLGVMHDDNWKPQRVESISQGRFPANLIHDGSQQVMALFPETKTGARKARTGKRGSSNPAHMSRVKGDNEHQLSNGHWPADNGGSAARFFYCAKASKKDRDEGLDEFEDKLAMRYGEKAQGPLPKQTPSKPTKQKNHHPTVKPTDLMRYLCRLITPPNGTVLDPYTGSGSTGKAAMMENFNFIGIELDEEYHAIAESRIKSAKEKA